MEAAGSAEEAEADGPAPGLSPFCPAPPASLAAEGVAAVAAAAAGLGNTLYAYRRHTATQHHTQQIECTAVEERREQRGEGIRARPASA